MSCPNITKEGLWDGRLIHFASLPSTNSWAKDNANSCGHGDIILADDQTEGRGRFERSWSSALGRSLTLSVIVDSTHFPLIPKENFAQIAALAVWQLLAGLKIEALLKWPNDIMTSRGKICGILAESITETKIVLGIGVNVVFDHNEDTATRKSTSIHHETEDIPEIPALVSSLSKCLATAFEDCSQSSLDHIKATWEAHDYLAGRTITVSGANGDQISGKYEGITREGLLTLNVEGEIRTFHSGDVTLG